MSSKFINVAEGFEILTEAFTSVNFTAFDLNSIKQALLDYLKASFPETFNDFIESSELIALLELFAYVGTLIAYRNDLNAHENFLPVAQRKEAVLRLAKLLSYKVTRNLPARGLVKINSIVTTESLLDSNNNNLANVKVFWNDTTDLNWKERFLLVMDRILEQEFGTAPASDVRTIDGVTFSRYGFNNIPLTNGVFRYNTTVSRQTLPMELVPTVFDGMNIVESRPTKGRTFSVLYATDGLGDTSDLTGFFAYTKQGSTQKITIDFEGVVPNQTIDLDTPNINELDLYVNNVDPDTGEITDDGSVDDRKSGEWIEVDLANAQNIIFNTNPNRNKYETETLDQDRVRLIFGDGDFSNIPAGRFDIWYRTSANSNVVIPSNSIQNQSASFNYLDTLGNVQTLTVEFSLVSALNNASASEDIERIRRTAPAVYYTQDRMVSDRDYNTYLLQDPSILKIKALNRTWAGDSKYLHWHDPRGSYENVKLMGTDLTLFYKPVTRTERILDENTLCPSPVSLIMLEGFVENELTSTEVQSAMMKLGVQSPRIAFTALEKTELDSLFLQCPADSVYLAFVPEADYPNGKWTSVTIKDDWIFQVLPIYDGTIHTGWDLTIRGSKLTVDSQSTKFWNENTALNIDLSAATTSSDSITILQPNLDYSRTRILPAPISLAVKGKEVLTTGPDVGSPNVHQLIVTPADINNDGIPDTHQLNPLFDPREIILSPSDDTLSNIVLTITEFQYHVGIDDLLVFNQTTNELLIEGTDWEEMGSLLTISNQVRIISNGKVSMGDELILTKKDYVYFRRDSLDDPFVPVPDTLANKVEWLTEDPNSDNQFLFSRERGRSDLNFLWLHYTPRLNAIDPAFTNIIDIYVLTQAYYNSVLGWLAGNAQEPTPPTSLDLRLTYANLLKSKMISDTVVLHPGKIKPIFGEAALPGLQAIIKVIKSPSSLLSELQIKTAVIDQVRSFFDIQKWQFGETFYFSELSAAIHAALPGDIDSVMLVPRSATGEFGDLYQINANSDEVVQPSISVNDVEIIEKITSENIRK